MVATLPRATGLKIINGLKGNPKGLDLQFQPSVAVISRSLDQLGLDIRSHRVPLQRALKQVIIPSIQKNFDVGGRPRWAALSDYTIERKGGDSRPLIRSGALRRQMSYQKNWRITKTFLVLQDLPESVWYGKVHQAGADFGGGRRKVLRIVGTGAKSNERKASVQASHNIPARPFVVLQKDDIRKIESIFRHWLQERVDQAARRMR